MLSYLLSSWPILPPKHYLLMPTADPQSDLVTPTQHRADLHEATLLATGVTDLLPLIFLLSLSCQIISVFCLEKTARFLFHLNLWMENKWGRGMLTSCCKTIAETIKWRITIMVVCRNLPMPGSQTFLVLSTFFITKWSRKVAMSIGGFVWGTMGELVQC